MIVWFDLIIHFFTVLTFIAYCTGVLTPKHNKIKTACLYIFWSCVIVLVSHFFRYTPPLRFCFVFIAMHTAIFFTFKGSLFTRIRTNAECVLISLVGELCVYFVHSQLLSDFGIDITVYDSPERALFSLITTTLVASITPIAILIRNRAGLFELWRIVLFQIGLGILQISMTVLAFWNSIDKSIFLVVAIALVQLPGILITLFCSRTILQISNMYLGRTVKKYRDIKTEMEYDYYRLALESHSKISVLRHDMNNTLQTVRALIRSGEIAKGTELINNFEAALESAAQVVYCDNDIINIILSVKRDEMRRLGINMRVTVTSELKGLPLGDLELVCVLTNLLDNAAEACEGLTDGKIVTVSFGHIQGYYVIKVINPYFNDDIPTDVSNADTTKKDKALHGFGLRSVYDICKRYGGNFSLYKEKESVIAVATFSDDFCNDGECIIV